MVRTPEYTPITPIAGGLVHATTLQAPFHTACGLEWRGWKIVPRPLTCAACEAALYRKTDHGLKQGLGKRKKAGGKSRKRVTKQGKQKGTK